MRFPCCSRSVRSPGISPCSRPDTPAMGTRTLPHPLCVALSAPQQHPAASPSPLATPPSSSSSDPGANQASLGACRVWNDNSAAPIMLRRKEAVGLDPLKPHENDLQGEGRDGGGGQPSPTSSQLYARSSPSCPQLPSSISLTPNRDDQPNTEAILPCFGWCLLLWVIHSLYTLKGKALAALGKKETQFSSP